MKRLLIATILTITIVNPVSAQVAKKLGITTFAERSNVFCLINCKSEIDKCVDAKVREICAPYFPDMKNPENGNMNSPGEPKISCSESVLKVVGGGIREQCLKAAAGKS